jgi:HB1, ASXL, restriction endonuclease HTH domain
MAPKKKTPTTPAASLQTLKIGSRVRCTDDQAEGRIVWANGVSVKITWNDGEQVTWRRDSLAGRPIEILGGDEDQAAAPAAEQPEPAQAADETAGAAPKANVTEPNAASADTAAAPEAPPPAPEPTEASPEPEAATEAPTAADEPTEPGKQEPPTPATQPTEGPPEAAAACEPTQTASKPKRQRKAPAEPQDKKLSALDAAAKVLAETHTPMNCQELIGAMAVKGYWTSPGGKTPAATLYSAMLREITTKGDQARFTKTGRGYFAYQRA